MLHIVVMSYFIVRAKGLVSNIIVVPYYNTVAMCCDVACSTPSVLVVRDFGMPFLSIPILNWHVVTAGAPQYCWLLKRSQSYELTSSRVQSSVPPPLFS
jgi:hypothetical protein